jgi:uncharacterized membrane protein YhaH (DUF805 family)
MMSRDYRSYEFKSDKRLEKEKIHPIWRGIGFIFMVLVPFLSYFGGQELIKANWKYNWAPVPVELAGPDISPYLYLKLAVAVVLMILIYIVFLIITFVFNQIAGAPRYGPHDSPPLRYKNVKRK